MISVSSLTTLINQLLPEPHAGLLAGILFGVKATLNPALKQALIITGTLHIVALSGMNITILATLVTITLVGILPRRIAGIVTITLIAFFIWFVGPSPSIVRAGIMGCIPVIGVFAGKQIWTLWSWGIAVVCMLLIRPLWITDLSFQLSVLASLGMIVFGKDSAKDPPDRAPVSWSRSIVMRLYDDLHTTMAAQVFTTPLLFFTFGRLSLVAPLTNILIVWVVPIVTVLGFVVVLSGLLWVPLGQGMAWVTWVFLEYMIRVIGITSKIPFASIGG